MFQTSDILKCNEGPLDFELTRAVCFSFAGGYLYNDFAWDLVSSSIPSAYICEIDRKDFDQDRTLDRDFRKYGCPHENSFAGNKQTAADAQTSVRSSVVWCLLICD